MGGNIKEFQDSHRSRAKISFLFLERGLDILFYIYNEATVVSAGLVDAKLQMVAPGYLLNITLFVLTSPEVSKEHFYRIFSYLAWGDFLSLPYKTAWLGISKSIVTN